MPKYIFKFLSSTIILVGVWFWNSAVLANSEKWISSNQYDTLTNVEPVNVMDSAYSLYSSQIDQNFSRKNIISVYIDENSGFYPLSSFIDTVYISYTLTNYSGQVISGQDKLVIDYNSINSAAYKLRDYRIYSDVYISNVNIDSSKTNVTWNAKKLVKLSNEILVRRSYTWENCQSMFVSSLIDNNPALESGNDNSYDELAVSWGSTIKADEYDFEWRWVDNEALGLYNSNPKLIFDNNSTRVSIIGNEYKIPLLYDGDGKVFYRVRIVKILPDGNRQEGPWSHESGGPGLRSYTFHGFQRNLNWQSTTSFAEEGKRKVVVNYFDGTLRSRQTVTKDNSTLDNNTIVAETFYDKQGRATIQVLPAPTLNTLVTYAKNFNLNNQANGFGSDDFDLLGSSVNNCSGSAAVMSNTSGASNYYSSNNSYSGTGYHKYIPDANGYPYTQTEYTQDNTGRIARQGGVGETFQLNSDHETKYYYGKPTQEELDLLFGTEAGNAGHYFKNMVFDANKQASISYVDMHGRTVATSLAGKAPDDVMIAIPSNLSQSTPLPISITENLIQPNSQVIDRYSIVNTTGLNVPVEGIYSFDYRLTPPTLTIESCTPDSYFCFDCLFDLEFLIIDQCGVEKYNQQYKGLKVSDNDIIVDSDCNGEEFHITPSVTLAEGNYTIVKRLTIRKETFDRYRDEFIAADASCKTYENFYQEVQDELEIKKFCEPLNCDACLTNIGTKEDFQTGYFTKMGFTTSAQIAAHQGEADAIWNEMVESCNSLCKDRPTPFNVIIRQAMLNDMVPLSGQYALDNPQARSDYRNIFYQDQYKGVLYKDINNQNIWVVNAKGESVSPATLDKDEFIRLFDESWALSLMKALHPERGRLLYADAWQQSYEYDAKLSATDTYVAAYNSGTNTGFFSPETNDPALNGTITLFSGFSSSFINLIKHYTSNGNPDVSIWTLAAKLVTCPPGSANNCLTQYTGTANTNIDTEVSGLTCVGDYDMVWRNFRAIYLQIKNKILYDKLSAEIPFNPGPNSQYQERFTNPQPSTVFGETVPGPTEAQLDAKALAEVNKLVDENCRSYVSLWKQKLDGCMYTEAQWLELEPQLIELCKAGGDFEHVTGSSTVKPGSTHTPTSFIALIQQFNASKYITTNTVCNGYLISNMPPPYDAPLTAVAGTVQIRTTPEPCVCTNLNNYYSQFQAEPAGTDQSFGDYLRRTLKISLTDETIELLKSQCDAVTAPSCHFMMTPIEIPPALSVCNELYKAPCIDCNTYKLYYSQFETAFPGIVPSYSNNSETEQANNNVFQHFMNFATGFGYTTPEYLDFAKRCVSMQSTVYPIGLDTIISNFKSLYYNAPLNRYSLSTGCNEGRWNSGKTIISTGKASIYPLNSVIKEGQFVPYIDPAYNNQGFSTIEYYDTVCVSQKLTFEARVKFPKTGIRYNPYEPTNNDYTFQNYFYFKRANHPEDNGYYYDYVLKGYNNSSDELYLNTPSTTYGPYTSPSIEDWSTIKVEILPDVIKYYINGTLVSQNAHDPFAEFQGFYFSPYAPSFRIDWIRMYDEYGKLIFNENFDNECGCRAYITKDPCKPECSTAFSSYFNTEGGRSSSYTYSQIQSLVKTQSGYDLDVCEVPGVNPDLCTQVSLCGRSESAITRVTPDPNAVCEDKDDWAAVKATWLYQQYREKLISDFERRYLEACLSGVESLTLQRPYTEHHFTLYYYDQAGNLVKTIPPQAVDDWLTERKTLNNNNLTTAITNWCNDVKQARNSASPKTPDYLLASSYRYNSLNQVALQETPDAGVSKFWYDRLGRLVVSQNAKQLDNNDYSYTIYDELGRIYEVGQKNNSWTPANYVRERSSFANWLNNGAANSRTQITRTIYDKEVNPNGNTLLDADRFAQINLRNRVSCSVVIDEGANPIVFPLPTTIPTMAYRAGTFYTYDIHGNVSKLLNHYRQGVMLDALSNEYKVVKYDYDLISGKVNLVTFQPAYTPDGSGGSKITPPDRFFHRYEYDAENRLTDVYTSFDDVYWEREASYQYYRHGPLARTVLGQALVQGIDYAYTLQGWLKGVNGTAAPDISNSSAAHTDMGNDGISGSTVARDAFGFGLHYFEEATKDYKPIVPGVTDKPFAKAKESINTTFRSLYNGNIAAMAVNISKLGDAQLYSYRYDQLNRISSSGTISGFNSSANSWSSGTLTPKYNEAFTYDANGNILTANRAGNLGGTFDMDQLIYQYPKQNSGKFFNNKLRYVYDDKAAGTYLTDIDNQTTKSKTTVEAENLIVEAADNFQYDKIGNLISDNKENITSITWTVYGKIASISKSGEPTIYYSYDAAGNRISKIRGDVTTWYVRDAQGNTLATYVKGESATNNGDLSLKEMMLYGSSRLGLINADLNIENPLTSPPFFERGRKLFELTNHLGNVLATISDRKIPVASGSSVSYYKPDIKTATDYYSFGMPMPGRTYSATGTEPSSLIIPWGGINGYSGGELLTNCEDNFTIELWVKPTSTHEVDQVFAGNDGINGQKYVIDPPQALYFNNSWTDAGAGISVGTNGVSIYEHNYGYIPAVLVWQGDVINWTHIALVYENKIPKLYINGNLVGTGVTSPKTHVYPGTLVGSGVFGTMNGEVDEVRIWNTVRTQQQIQENMNKSVATPQTNLEAYWPIKTGEITNLQDISGNSHNVVLPTGNNYGSYSNGSGSTAPLSGDYFYRYGFNGKENDNEVKGTGNQIDFGARIYDPRLGRFFSTDPRKEEYPWQSTYAYHRNNFIAWIDYMGGGDPPIVENGVYFVKLKNPTAEIVYNQDLFSFTQMMSGRYDNSSTTDYTVNLQQYKKASVFSYLRAWSPAMGGNDFITMGQNVQDGKATGDATDNKRGYFSQSKDGKWQAGLGNPPAGSSVGFGGGIPIIVGGQKYSSTAHDGYLEAEGYGSQNSTTVGKVVIGLNSKDNSMILVVSPDELKTGGMTLDAIRDRLAGQGYDYVFGFDGGSSSTLIQDGDKKLVTPIWFKDNTIPAGVTLTEK